MKKHWHEEEHIITVKNNPRCENCQFYIFIDSGYGRCRRFPPKEVRSWLGNIIETKYPVVEWCRKSCGEHKKNNL